MRVLRTILGMLLLTIGLPSLLAGTALWAAMQHRDQGGAFTGELQRLATPGYAFVIPDVDRLLRSDAPFTRIGDTQLRINARTGDGPAFLGLAPTATVEDYLRGVPHSTIRTVDIGTGALPVATNALPGRLAPRQLPGQTSFWLRSSADGQLAWTPGDVRGGPYSLVIMSAGAKPGLQLTSSAELRPGWLNSSTWGLLTLGTLLLMVGLIVLSWPARRREVVYVVEPSQVPDLMAAIGAPLPLNTLSPARPVGAHRPRTLADSQKAPALAAAPQLTWPPALSGPPNPEEYAAATAIPGGSKSSVPVGAMALGAEPGSVLAAAAGSVGSAAGPAVGGAAGRGGAGAVGGSGVGLIGGSAGGSPVGLAGGSASDPGGSTGGSAVGSNLGSGSAVGAAAALMPASASAAGRSAAGRKPAPGEPLGFIKPTSVGGAVSLPLGDPPSAADPLFGRRLDRGGKLRAPEPGDLPLFQASAVGAWVAETAAERARVTEATAAARMAEVARRRAAANGSRPTTDTPNGRGGAPARDARADDSVAATALAAPPVSSGPVSSGPVSSGPVSSAPVSSAPAKAGTAASAPNGSVAGGTAAVPQGSAESAPASAGAGPAGSTPVPATPADSDDEHGEPGTEASRRPSPGRPSPGNGGGRRGRHASPSQAPSGDDAVAAAYAAGAADARAFRGEVAPRSAEMPARVPADSTMARDPRTAGQRVAVITGPNATDWTALGLTRADSPRIGRQQPTSARPAPGRQAPGGSRPSPAAPAPVSRNATPAASPTAGTQGIGVPAPTAQAAGMPGAAAQAADVPAPVAHSAAAPDAAAPDAAAPDAAAPDAAAHSAAAHSAAAHSAAAPDAAAPDAGATVTQSAVTQSAVTQSAGVPAATAQGADDSAPAPRPAGVPAPAARDAVGSASSSRSEPNVAAGAQSGGSPGSVARADVAEAVGRGGRTGDCADSKAPSPTGGVVRANHDARGAGDLELGASGATAGRAGVTVQGGPGVLAARDTSGQLQPVMPVGDVGSSDETTTATAGAESPLSASRERQAAGADTDNGRRDRGSVSAPRDGAGATDNGPKVALRPAAPGGSPAVSSAYGPAETGSAVVGKPMVPARARPSAPVQPAGPARAAANAGGNTDGPAGEGRISGIAPVTANQAWIAAGAADVSALMHAMARGERAGSTAEATPTAIETPTVGEAGTVTRPASSSTDGRVAQRPMPTPSGPRSPADEGGEVRRPAGDQAGTRPHAGPGVIGTRPTTGESPDDSRPPLDEGAAGNRPSLDEGTAVSRPSLDEGTAVSHPPLDEGAAGTRPAQRSMPTQEDGEPAPRPMQRQVPQSETDQSTAEPKPAISEDGPASGFASRLPGPPSGRPAPAAWRKAAENVAARAAAAANVQQEDEETDGDQPVRLTRIRAAKTPKPPAKATPTKATPTKATPTKAASKKAAKNATAAKDPKATQPKPTPAKATPAKATPAKATPAKATPAKATPAKAKATPAKAKATPAKTTPTMAKATPPDGGLSSYRREAAELFAASAQRRRRRAIADPGPIVEIEEAPSTAPARRRRPAPGMSELD